MTLKEIRREKGLSQAKLATMAGCSAMEINYIERGKTKPNETIKASIAGLFGLDVKEIFAGDKIQYKIPGVEDGYNRTFKIQFCPAGQNDLSSAEYCREEAERFLKWLYDNAPYLFFQQVIAAAEAYKKCEVT